MPTFKDKSEPATEIQVSEGASAGADNKLLVPDRVIDISEGISELLAMRKGGSVDDLSKMVARCCLQACDCCLQIQ